MLRYTLRRIVLLIPVLVGLSMLVFAIARLLPGDPARLAAGPNATPAEIAEVVQTFGLNKSLPVQYWDYVTGLLRGDWGRSIYTRRPVLQDLEVYLPATLELVMAAMVMAVVLGVPAGVLAAVHRNRWPDILSRTVSIGAISMPRFFLALLL
jgi:peptide/nickel transport system permease protein